jgi:iron complex outermembrane receptor protein
MDGTARFRSVGKPLFLTVSAFLAVTMAFSQVDDTLPPPDEMKKMSLEELMDIQVTLVSKHPEKLSQAASAVQVITQEDIHRSGAANLPDALRLAPNLQVAQLNSREWAISARGFNSTAANKLLVMIDGRTVYTPLYSGVFWDAQEVLLEDVDRIEVISGPGGTLWGSNAVNGVINIITKESANTQGVLLAGEGGNYTRDYLKGRYGGKLGKDVSFRVYRQHVDQGSTLLPGEKDANNGWDRDQEGFRMDWARSDADKITAQGDVYEGSFDQPNSGKVSITGQNVIGGWTHTFGPESDLQVQVYFDRTWRKAALAPTVAFVDDMKTYDFDFHHRFPLGGMNSILWGAGYRIMQDDADNFPFFAFIPARVDLHRFNAFAQDEVQFFSHRLKFTLGSKVEHEDYSGYNLQPALRAAWTPNDRHTIWAAVSRAIRTPSRIDVDFYAPEPPVTKVVPHYAGSPRFSSEKTIAYELGYRIQPIEALSLSLATFYNQYDGLRSVELTDVSNLRVEFLNGLEGDSRGAELSGNLQAARWWKLRGGYTYLESDIWVKTGHMDLTNPHGEWNDPANQFTCESMMDLPAGFQVNVTGFYVETLRHPVVKTRLNYDAGIVWLYRKFEVSVYGRNLADDHDPEFGPKAGRQEIPRSVSGRLAWRM